MAFLAGVPVGLLTAAILWINQFPDLQGDKSTGKHNLVVTIRTMFQHYDDRLLKPANAGTINLHLVTGILLSIGIWVG